MYTIKETTGNLVLVKTLKSVEKKVGVLYMPNSKGKYAICEVIKVGTEVKNTSIKENVIVAVPSILLDKSSSLDDTFGLPTEIIINKEKEALPINENEPTSDRVFKEEYNKSNPITKEKIEYYLLQEYSIELILENVEDTP